MHHHRRHVDDVVVLTPAVERIDTQGASELKEVLLAEVEQGTRRLLLNLASVAFIDSAGLSAIISALKQMGDHGDLRICCAQPDVRAILELARLDRLVPIYDGQAEAIMEFESPAT